MPTPKKKPKAKKNVLELINVPKADQHWYVKTQQGICVPYSLADPETRDGLPLYKSVTTMTGQIPKGIGFDKWLGGFPSYELAMEFTAKAAKRGSSVHNAMEHLVLHPKTKLERDQYTNEEWDHLYGMALGLQSLNAKVLWVEQVVWDDDDMTAGMADLYAQVGKEKWMIDYKTSKQISLSHKVQVQKYARAAKKSRNLDVDKMCIIRSAPRARLGYEIEVFDFDERYDEAYAACVLFHKLLYPRAKPAMKTVPTFLSGDMLIK